MDRLELGSKRKKPYAAPRVVDFGAIADMTDGCLGICTDGENGGHTWIVP